MLTVLSNEAIEQTRIIVNFVSFTGSNQQPVSQLPLHVTPKKTSPESRDKSINTPMKLLQSSDQHTVRSPRRKKLVFVHL
jgi:hypothetical protein